ncbi:MAG TPA: hypothetical protein VMA31_10860 [Bryobacteraceae bacterium]|nr:hypothetical protein [Bryobacteraceae bacterium]
MQIATDLEALIQDLRDELRAMGERVARLEAERAPAAKPAAEPAAPAAAPVPEPRSSRPTTGQPGTPAPHPSRPATGQPGTPAPQEISEEELTAISAAVAAYLGVRAHIRQIRLVSSRAWAQEGRVTVQASHQLH